MKILRDIYDKMIELPIVPPESGGIIGGRFDVISDFEIIGSKTSSCFDLYIPDVTKINETINKWNLEGIIDFYGIVHTHRPCSPELSPGDIEYIKEIMISVADIKKELLFPVVIPQKQVNWYCAKLIKNELEVIEELVEII